ncbi:MAG: geranylgeranylglyceryl/heptaprenylglyceryl phosphate synthase [Bacteroidetes bacterium]|nr:geranylgeranylglyceryl/heptaprenylglyceryl phosphate synthase [Bacteroidota bacterium]
MKIYDSLQQVINLKGAAYLVLIDPDKTEEIKLGKFVSFCEKNGVDGFLIGGSLLTNGDLSGTINIVKKNSSLPVIIFPGAVNQVVPNADAILFISLISGRNAEQLIGKHVFAAPIIKKYNIEPISTGYILVESGNVTTAGYMSGSIPVPRNKPEIAASTALAAEYLGMKLIYLEAGSGADISVPEEMIKLVTETCSVPVIVGGGIKDADTARSKVKAGAKIIVTGNYFENQNNWEKIKEFAQAVHIKESIKV